MMSGEWVIAGQEGHAPPVVGKSYEVRHSRKGTFDVKVLSVAGSTAEVEILAGIAKAVMRYNVAGPGETIRVTATLTYWIPLPETP